MLTDHKHFVLANIYAPNAGDSPARARLPFKLRWFAALEAELDSWAQKGRRVIVVGDFNIPCTSSDVHSDFGWADIYSDQVTHPAFGLWPGFSSPAHLRSAGVMLRSYLVFACALIP